MPAQWLDRNPKDMGGWRFLLPLVKGARATRTPISRTLEQLVQLDPPTSARYELDLGNLYFAKGDYEGAEKALLGATKGSPGSAALWYRLGETQVKLRKEKESEEKFRRAAQLDPTNLTYARASSRAVNTKDEIKANLALFKFLAQNGPSVEERKKLAQAYYLNSDYQNAAKEFDWLLKGDPSLGASEPMISDAYMKTGPDRQGPRPLRAAPGVRSRTTWPCWRRWPASTSRKATPKGYLKSIREDRGGGSQAQGLPAHPGRRAREGQGLQGRPGQVRRLGGPQSRRRRPPSKPCIAWPTPRRTPPT